MPAFVWKTKLIQAATLASMERSIENFINVCDNPAFKTALTDQKVLINIARSDKRIDEPWYIASIVWKDII